MVRDLRIETDSETLAGRKARLVLTAPGGPKDLAAFSEYRWRLGDGLEEETAEPECSCLFERPGCVRVLVSASGDAAAGTASRIVCVLPSGGTVAGCSDPAAWELVPGGEGYPEHDPVRPFAGTPSLRTAVAAGTSLSLVHRFPDGLDLRTSSGIVLFYRYACELATHTGKVNRIIGIEFEDDSGSRLEHTRIWRTEKAPSEERYDWTCLPAVWDDFSRHGDPDFHKIAGLTVRFGPETAAYFEMNIGGVYALPASDTIPFP